MSVEGKIDNLTSLVEKQGEKLDCLDDKIKKMYVVLGGSGMGDKGLLEQYNELQDSHHKLKRNVRDKDIQNKAYTTAIGGGVGIWEWIRHSF